MSDQKAFRDGTVNLVFSSVDELLQNFEENYRNSGEFRRIPGVHSYSDILKVVDPTVSGTVIYLVQVDDNSEGSEFGYLGLEAYRIMAPFDTVLQLSRLNSAIVGVVDGMGQHKVYDQIYSEFG